MVSINIDIDKKVIEDFYFTEEENGVGEASTKDKDIDLTSSQLLKFGNHWVEGEYILDRKEEDLMIKLHSEKNTLRIKYFKERKRSIEHVPEMKIHYRVYKKIGFFGNFFGDILENL